MHWWKTLLLALAVCLMSGDIALSAEGTGALAGDWDGALALPAFKLRLALHIETHDGTNTGTLTSIDQGGKVMPLASVARDGANVSFVLDKPNASFQGTLSADGTSLAGNWTQNGSSLPLSFTRRAPGAAGPVLNRPQEPHPPYPYRAEDVVYDGPGGIKLAGTLTLPKGRAPFAAAILIAGSGPNDRDEAIMGHKPFLVLADYLTRHGIAVLRSDKRGVGRSTGDFKSATSKDFANDVQSAISYLKTRPEIDPRKIGLIGHSEGGLIAPIVAAKDRSIAYIVLMAGPGLNGADILTLQRRLIAQAMGLPQDKIDSNEVLARSLNAAVESAKSDDDARAKAEAILKAAKPDAPAGAFNAQLDLIASPWFRFFLAYDPVPALRAVRCPVLAVNGEKDLQVPPKEDLAAIKAALSGNPDATTAEIPGLNHLFQHAKTGAPSEYSEIEETIAPVALITIATWVVAHTTEIH